MREIARLNRRQVTLEPSAAALLVIDMQRYFLEPEAAGWTCGGAAILPKVVELVASFRQAGRPVIFTQHCHRADGSDLGNLGWWWSEMCVEGTPEAEIVPALAPLPSEPVLVKRRYSAFIGTELADLLEKRGVRDLVITGVMTNVCCETTAREAFMRDYRVFFCADGTGSQSEELHLSSLRTLAYGFAKIVTVGEMIARLAI